MACKAVDVLGRQLGVLKQNLPRYRREIDGIEREQSQRAQGSEDFLQWLYHAAGQHLLDQHNTNIVMPLMNAPDSSAFQRRQQELGFIYDWQTSRDARHLPDQLSTQQKLAIAQDRMRKAGHHYSADQIVASTPQQRYAAMLDYLQYIIDNKLPVGLDQREAVVEAYETLKSAFGHDFIAGRRREILSKFGLATVAAQTTPTQEFCQV